MSASLSTYPNFFIIGVPKGGTTSLYAYLQQHPDVFLPYVKEPCFFSNEENYDRGIAWYSKTFFRDVGSARAIGEATPWYFSNKRAAERIKRELPESSHRFIVIFRDPVERAYSMYWNRVENGDEKNSFEVALSTEDERLREGNYHATGSLTVGYRYVGNYATHLREWLAKFPSGQFLFLLQQDLAASPESVLTDIYQFLRIRDDIEIDTTRRHNVAGRPRYRALLRVAQIIRARTPAKLPLKLIPKSLRFKAMQYVSNTKRIPVEYPPMAASIERDLRGAFRVEIEELEGLIGKDLSAWK